MIYLKCMMMHGLTNFKLGFICLNKCANVLRLIHAVHTFTLYIQVHFLLHHLVQNCLLPVFSLLRILLLHPMCLFSISNLTPYKKVKSSTVVWRYLVEKFFQFVFFPPMITKVCLLITCKCLAKNYILLHFNHISGNRLRLRVYNMGQSKYFFVVVSEF
jgi:hypothetical protein